MRRPPREPCLAEPQRVRPGPLPHGHSDRLRAKAVARHADSRLRFHDLRRSYASWLTGMAAGDAVERATRDVLADVLAVMGADSAAHWDTIAGRLAQQMP